MKKLLLSLSVILLSTAINAQIVTSRSVSISNTPQESKTTRILRIGIGTNTFSGDDYKDFAESRFGYNIAYEFNKTIRNKGAYWGMSFALGSRGYNVEDEDDSFHSAHNIQWSPFTFGWKIKITDDIKVDPHIGAFISGDYAGKYKWGKDEEDEETIYDTEDYNYFDAGMNIGVGIWYKRFNLDLMYQKGFLGEFTEDSEGSASNFLVRLGIAF